MSSSNRKLILISLILATITTVILYEFSINKEQVTHDVQEYGHVLVASQDIPAGTQLKPEMVKKVRMEKEFINGNSLKETGQIEDKYAKQRIYKDEQILSYRLVDSERRHITYSIPEGKRAVSINVSEVVAVSNLLNPGDYVDIIATFEQHTVKGEEDDLIYPRITKIILQNILVLNIGDKRIYHGEEYKGEQPRTITLAVSPEDSEKLVFSENAGSIRLALRPAMDDTIADTPGIIREDITPDRGYIYKHIYGEDGGEQNE